MPCTLQEVTQIELRALLEGGYADDVDAVLQWAMEGHWMQADKDKDGQLVLAAYNINTSGGMEQPDMLKWLNDIAVPATKVTPEKRGVACLDGLGQHHHFDFVRADPRRCYTGK